MEGGEIMKQIDYKDFDILRIGNELEITGVVYGNTKSDNVLIVLPDEEIDTDYIGIMTPNIRQWEQLIRQSDIKEIAVGEVGKKIILRKSTRQIETKVMWEVFRRDNYTCRYCGNDKIPLTVDHVVLWEDMGPSIPMNLITSCRKCNNQRGSTRYEDWIQCPYYLANVVDLPVDMITKNARVIGTIPDILENHLRYSKRSR